MIQGDGFYYHQLDNGLRIAVHSMPATRSVAMGFLAQTGSRDEPRGLAGASHFCEHMCFKGTGKRTWRDVTVCFDQMGSTYNAYTSKDRTFYYGWVRPEDMAVQIELLADMMRSTFPADQFEMEKQVILEEIAMSDDRLEDLMIDLTHEQVFGDHALGWPVLGYRETIGRMSRDQLMAYFGTRYTPSGLTLLAAGNVAPDAVVAAAEHACGQWSPGANGAEHRRPPLGIGCGSATRQTDRFAQQGVALIFAAPSATDAEREVARAVASILGGDNSRFYWNVVQAGIAPMAGAWWADYHDCGMMVLYGQCTPDRVEAMVDAIRREANRLTADGAEDHEVQRVKNRRRTALAAEAESPSHRLGQMVDDMDLRGQLRTVEDRLDAVDAVNAAGISEYLDRWSIISDGYLISVGPRDWPGDGAGEQAG